jgi:hypothetical protein
VGAPHAQAEGSPCRRGQGRPGAAHAPPPRQPAIAIIPAGKANSQLQMTIARGEKKWGSQILKKGEIDSAWHERADLDPIFGVGASIWPQLNTSPAQGLLVGAAHAATTLLPQDSETPKSPSAAT